MLLRVTTHYQRFLFCVNTTPTYEETRITLPVGTYNFRDHPNPLRPNSDSKWLVLEEAELSKLGLKHDAIVGMSYNALMFYGSPACGYADMMMDIEDITPTMTVVQPVVTSKVRPKNPARQVIPLPIRYHPSFIQYCPPRGNSNVLYLGLHRVKKYNSRARRVCNG